MAGNCVRLLLRIRTVKGSILGYLYVIYVLLQSLQTHIGMLLKFRQDKFHLNLSNLLFSTILL